jgi:hypothetical protein
LKKWHHSKKGIDGRILYHYWSLHVPTGKVFDAWYDGGMFPSEEEFVKKLAEWNRVSMLYENTDLFKGPWAYYDKPPAEAVLERLKNEGP